HLPVGAPGFLGALDADGLEALPDGVGGLIDGDDALARGHHGLGGFGELVDTHGDSGGVAGGRALYPFAAGRARSHGRSGTGNGLRVRPDPRRFRSPRPAAGAGCWWPRATAWNRRWSG